MKSVPMNRARALIVCSRPEAYEPTRVHEAATYLLQMAGATEDEKRLASDAIKWLGQGVMMKNINWWRGFVRLWIVASLCWIAGMVIILRPTLPPIAWPWSPPPVIHANDTDYPAAWGVERIRAAIAPKLAALLERRDACENLRKTMTHEPIPEDCRKFFPPTGIYWGPALWADQFDHLPVPVGQWAATVAPIAFAPRERVVRPHA